MISPKSIDNHSSGTTDDVIYLCHLDYIYYMSLSPVIPESDLLSFGSNCREVVFRFSISYMNSS